MVIPETNLKEIGICIKNCNNIEEGNMTIHENMLNIKYAMNGTGKSTISKAIKLYLEGNKLDDLVPFTQSGEPEVFINKSLNKVLVFDETFINNVVFKEAEVITNSFDIFIKTPNYDIRRQQLNERLRELKVDIGSHPDIVNIQKSSSEVSKKILLNQDKSVKKNPFVKSLLKRDNLFNIPPKLHKYKNFMQEEYSVEWIDWKSKGYSYDNNNVCPFCTEKLDAGYTEEKTVFKSTYDKKSTKDLIDMLNYFIDLKEYINDEKYYKLLDCIKKETDENTLSLELGKFIQELNFIREKISAVIEFDSYRIKNEEISELDKKVKKLSIDESMLDIFNSTRSISILTLINQKIEKIYNEVEELKREVGKLNGYITAAIEQSKRDINAFLESAGISYEVDILVSDENNAKTTLKYKSNGTDTFDVGNIKKHLSWGEKNAFSLVLFMYYSIQQNVDIVILDDPISSFDSNKKYSIINRLFKNMPNNNSFYKKTVLMLTHDFESVIDFIINQKPTGGFVKAHYVKNTNGILQEKPIEGNSDIKSMTLMLLENIKNNQLNIVHRVVFLRKFIEHTNQNQEEGLLAYDILSSLIHCKKYADKKISDKECIRLTKEELELGNKFIQRFIDDFSYEENLENQYTKNSFITQYENEENSYLKLQIFRGYLEIEDIRNIVKDDVILKFVDDIYHIENDYTYCLNFFKYDIVPNYILARINGFMENEKQKLSK